MRRFIQKLMLLATVSGMAGGVLADFRDFILTGPDSDDQWATLANWEEGEFPISSDVVRVQKDCHIAKGQVGTAVKTSIAGFTADAALYIDAGGTLESGSLGVEVAYSRKTGLLDVYGTLHSVGPIRLGVDASKTSVGTANFRAGSLVQAGGMVLGSTPNRGLFAVNQLGGTIQLSGDLLIADINESLANSMYAISGGTLTAKRLSMGADGTSSAKFSVNGSSSEINFCSTSKISGQSELEFIFDAAGVSSLSMTNGGYTVEPSVSITVDAFAYKGTVGSGILLIDISAGDSLMEFQNASVSIGCDLDYRAGDGLYLVQKSR